MDQNPNSSYVGTISREEWEALTIYQIFAFKKIFWTFIIIKLG
jgi:hypothetical protein